MAFIRDDINDFTISIHLMALRLTTYITMDLLLSICEGKRRERERGGFHINITPLPTQIGFSLQIFVFIQFSTTKDSFAILPLATTFLYIITGEKRMGLLGGEIQFCGESYLSLL